MPDTSGADRVFGIGQQDREHYDRTAHELAFSLAAAASHSIDDLDTLLRNCVSLALQGRPADPTHIALALTARHLAGMIRSLTRGASASTHPLAASLAHHSHLEDLEAEQLVNGIVKWLDDGAGS